MGLIASICSALGQAETGGGEATKENRNMTAKDEQLATKHQEEWRQEELDRQPLELGTFLLS
jgi:hypothetical protein